MSQSTAAATKTTKPAELDQAQLLKKIEEHLSSIRGILRFFTFLVVAWLILQGFVFLLSV